MDTTELDKAATEADQEARHAEEKAHLAHEASAQEHERLAEAERQKSISTWMILEFHSHTSGNVCNSYGTRTAMRVQS